MIVPDFMVIRIRLKYLHITKRIIAFLISWTNGTNVDQNSKRVETYGASKECLRVLVSNYYQISGTLFQKHFFMLYGEKAG